MSESAPACPAAGQLSLPDVVLQTLLQTHHIPLLHPDWSVISHVTMILSCDWIGLPDCVLCDDQACVRVLETRHSDAAAQHEHIVISSLCQGGGHLPGRALIIVVHHQH